MFSSVFPYICDGDTAGWIGIYSTQASNTVLNVCVVNTGNPEETAARATASEKDGDIKRISTKEWARSTGYDPVKLFNKVSQTKLRNLAVSDPNFMYMCNYVKFD